jgi:hypothetical protein
MNLVHFFKVRSRSLYAQFSVPQSDGTPASSYSVLQISPFPLLKGESDLDLLLQVSGMRLSCQFLAKHVTIIPFKVVTIALIPRYMNMNIHAHSFTDIQLTFGNLRLL